MRIAVIGTGGIGGYFGAQDIRASDVASRLRRRSGSVFEGRTLKCQSGYSTEMPSAF